MPSGIVVVVVAQKYVWGGLGPGGVSAAVGARGNFDNADGPIIIGRVEMGASSFRHYKPPRGSGKIQSTTQRGIRNGGQKHS